MAAMAHSLISEAVYNLLTPLSVWNLSKIAHARPIECPLPECMVRPRVARGLRRSGGRWSCINVSGLTLERVMLRAIMDISARAISLAARSRLGHSGHQYSHAPGRPIVHFVSSSRRPRRGMGIALTPSIASHLVQIAFSRGVMGTVGGSPMDSLQQVFGVNGASGKPLHLCPDCSTYIIAATRSERVSERCVRNVWSCEAPRRYHITASAGRPSSPILQNLIFGTHKRQTGTPPC
jgi:hypothetical protein